MAYKGNTDRIPCSKGGLTGAKNIDDIPNHMMVYPSRNINLEKNGRRKRGGTTLLLGSAYTGAPKILGLYHAYFGDSTDGFILAATADGDLYKDDTNKIATGMGAVMPWSFEMGEDKVFIADGINIPKVWSGSGSAAAISEPAADFSTSPPFQLMVHSRGASKRMCALNEHGIYMSASHASAGDMEKFSTGAEAMFVETGDGYGLVGMVEFGEDIFLFGKKKAYRVDDSSLDTTEWGYDPAQWEGGAANWRLIIKTPNDVVVMADDGEIYSITSVSAYGDYKQASLTRNSWMHDWIKDYVKLTEIDQFHGQYDPALRAIFFWVVRNGQTSVDTALVYFIDRSPEEAWMVHDNQTADSGYKAACSCNVKQISGPHMIFTGDYKGNIWKLNQANRSDNSKGYYAGFRTPNISIDDPRLNKHFNAGRILMSPMGLYNLTAKCWIDGVLASSQDVSMDGGCAVLGTFLLDTDILGGEAIIDTSFKIGKVGKRIQYEFFNSTANQDFFISGIMTDWKPTGNKQ